MPSPSPLDISRQTASKVLGYVVTDFFPGAQLAGSGITPIGFYADFVLTQPLDEKALPLIEERMRGAIKANHPIKIMDMMRTNAAAFFKHHKQYHLANITLRQPDDMVEVVEIGHFYDLSFGQTSSTTAEAGSIKLQCVNPHGQTIRIEGTCFPDNQKLKQFLKSQEAAKKRDHRIIGPEMRLFEESAGNWLWHPKGMFLKNKLLKHARCGQEVEWRGDFSVFKNYINANELPLCYYEMNICEEKAGWGLFEAVRFLKDVQYLFYSGAHIRAQLISSLLFINKTANILSFEYHWHLVVPNQKSPDQLVLEQALKEAGCEYSVQVGDKLCAEMRIVDLLGREWPAGAVSINQGVIVRSLYGSVERYIALLIEQYAGKFPLWLAPEQVRVVTVGEKLDAYAQRLYEQLKTEGFRVGIALGSSPLGAKVHAAEKERVPYLVIVGEKEAKSERVTMRSCYQDTVESGLHLDDIITRLRNEVDSEGLEQLGE